MLTKLKPDNKPDLKIDWCTHKAADHACKHWHYSGVIPVGKLVKVGAWENGKYIGCVLFGRGANNNMLKPFNLKQDQGCELVRIALREHKTPVSRIMTLAFKFLKKSNPLLRLIVSYADLDQNHHGGIYQATNWVYTGLMNAGAMNTFIINGKKVHPKSVYSKGVKHSIDEVRKHLDPNATVFKTKGKHRYLMPLDKNMRSDIISLSKPYPKRVPVEVIGDQPTKGGATPTDTLQPQGAKS